MRQIFQKNQCPCKNRRGCNRTYKKNAAFFLADLAASVVYDIELLDEAVSIAAKTTISGFDIIFITCAKITDSVLITDDKRMHDAAKSMRIRSEPLRRMRMLYCFGGKFASAGVTTVPAGFSLLKRKIYASVGVAKSAAPAENNTLSTTDML